MVDWLQTRRELTCLDAVSRFGPVCIGAINAVTGMPASYIHRHLSDMEDRGQVASYLGYDARVGLDEVTLWVIPEAGERVGWSGEALILFCGEEPPSIMQHEDGFSVGEGG